LPPAPAPALGEHIGDVLKGWLNLSDTDIAQVDKEGALV